MKEASGDSFFSELPAFADFSGVADDRNYRPLPPGWALAVADIVDSTSAIGAGRYKAVNMAGASVISAILNALDTVDLPFVFGGDGAIVAVPPEGIERAGDALAAVRSWVERDLGLELRAALAPVADIVAAGHEVLVARFGASADQSYAMFAGGGASWAEARMKEGRFAVPAAPPDAEPNLIGLSCRWKPVASRHGEIVSVIAVPGQAVKADAFRRLVLDIVALAASEEWRSHPIAPEGPQFGLSPERLSLETKATPRARRALRRMQLIAQYLLVACMQRFGGTVGGFNVARYRREVARNIDFRKFDDGLKMTIDVDPQRLEAIEARLTAAEAEGVCRFGLHRQDAALVTCFVPTVRGRNHMHFLDGASGGYAMAATALKQRRPADAPSEA